MAILSDGQFAEVVRDRQREWSARGIRAVPTFVFDEKYVISGAQDEDVFANILRDLVAEAVSPGRAPGNVERCPPG